jgi:hypothetical protein
MFPSVVLPPAAQHVGQDERKKEANQWAKEIPLAASSSNVRKLVDNPFQVIPYASTINRKPPPHVLEYLDDDGVTQPGTSGTGCFGVVWTSSNDVLPSVQGSTSPISTVGYGVPRSTDRRDHG